MCDLTAHRTGYPYNFVEVNTPDWADTLTSMPIALNGYFPESNIHLMFYVQGEGNARSGRRRVGA